MCQVSSNEQLKWSDIIGLAESDEVKCMFLTEK